MLRLVDPPAEPGENTVAVTVTVRGPRGRVYAVSSADVRSEPIDVWKSPSAEGPPVGPVQVDLRAEDFFLPGHPGVEVVAVRPSRVRLVLAEAARKIVPVRVIPRGKPRRGYVLSPATRAIPARVEVRAAPEVLEALRFVETEPVDIEGKDAAFSVSVDLVREVKVAGRARRLLAAPGRVVVVADIVPAPVEVLREHLPVRVLLPAGASFRLEPEPATVSLVLRGPEERVASLRDEDIKVFADGTGLGRLSAGTTLEVPLRVLLPAGLEVAGRLPGTIRVKVRKCQ